MAKKISDLNEPTVKPYDLNNLFALGYEKDKDKLTNVRINQGELRNVILSKIWDVVYDISDDGSTETTLKNKIKALSNELSALSTTTEADINDIRVKLSSIFTDKNISDEDIMSFINKDKKDSASSIEIFKAIIEKIKELHENQIDDDNDNPSNPPLIDTTEIENKINKLENVIGLNDVVYSTVQFVTPDSFSTTEGSAENNYNINAKEYNDTLAKYMVISSDEYGKKGIISKEDATSIINNINKSIESVSEHFIISSINIESSDDYIDYSKIDNLIESCNDTISTINDICDIIPLFYYEDGTSQDSQNNNYIKKLSDIKNELNTIDINDFIEGGYSSTILTLLDDISESYTEIKNKLNTNENKWNNIISVTEILDTEVTELRKLLNLENEDAIDFDSIKTKIGNFYDNLKLNFDGLSISINSNTIALKQLPEETKNQRDNITSSLVTFVQLVENPDIYELEKSLYDCYIKIETAFNNLTAIPENITETDIKNNAKIIEVKETLFNDNNDYKSNYGFDINDRSSSYIKSEIDSIKDYWDGTVEFDKNEIKKYFEHVDNIIASKSFVTQNNETNFTQNNETNFNTFFDTLKTCLDTYSCYWIDDENKSKIFIEINESLYDTNLLQFINVISTNENTNGAYLNEKIKAASTLIINDEVEIFKNNLIKITNSISGAEGVTEDRLSERLKPVEDDITDIETDITNIEDNISTIKKRLDIEVPGRINAESDKILNNLEPKIISNSNLLAENITKVNHLSDNIQNYSGFINYDIVHDEIDIDSLGIITVKGSTTTYKKYEADESGILYIIKGESTAIKFIPYTTLDTETNYEPNEFYKSLYCPEEGLNVPFISINLLKGSGIIFPSDVDQKLYFIPYLTVTEIDDIIKE